MLGKQCTKGLWLLTACGAWLLGVSCALALSPLPPGSSVALVRAPESTADPAQEKQLTTATTKLGFKVVDPARADTVLGDDGRCEKGHDCNLRDLRRRLGADAVVLFTFAQTGEGQRLQLRSLRADGQKEATGTLPQSPTVAALRRLMARVLGGEDTHDRPTTVLITTVPPHGQVWIDDRPAQEAPAGFQVKPGRHRIRGRLSGYASVVEQVDIPAQDTPFDYQLTLPQRSTAEVAPVAGPAQAPAETYAEPSAWNAVLAATLGVAAAGLTAYAAIEADRDGECVDQSAMGRCISEVDTEVAVIGASVGASIAGLSAVGLLLFKPLKVSAGPRDLGLVVNAAF